MILIAKFSQIPILILLYRRCSHIVVRGQIHVIKILLSFTSIVISKMKYLLTMMYSYKVIIPSALHFKMVVKRIKAIWVLMYFIYGSWILQQFFGIWWVIHQWLSLLLGCLLHGPKLAMICSCYMVKIILNFYSDYFELN